MRGVECDADQEGSVNVETTASEAEKFEPSEGVQFFASQWVHGARTEMSFGPISHDLFFSHADVEGALHELRGVMRDKVLKLYGNSMVSYEETIDPFATEEDEPGMWVHAAGLAVKLVSIFYHRQAGGAGPG